MTSTCGNIREILSMGQPALFNRSSLPSPFGQRLVFSHTRRRSGRGILVRITSDPVDGLAVLPVSGPVVVLRVGLPGAKREAGAALCQSRSCPRNCKR